MPFWAPRGFGSLLEPSEAFFLGREAARVFPCFSCLVFFYFPLCFVLRPHSFLEGPAVVSLTRRVVLPTPRRSDSQGTAHFRAGAIGRPLFGYFDGIFCLPEGYRDPRTQSVQGPFCWRGGPFLCLLRSLFSHCTFFVPAPFFSSFFGLWGQCLPWIARRCVSWRVAQM